MRNLLNFLGGSTGQTCLHMPAVAGFCRRLCRQVLNTGFIGLPGYKVRLARPNQAGSSETRTPPLLDAQKQQQSPFAYFVLVRNAVGALEK